MNKILTVAKHTFMTNFATKWFLGLGVPSILGKDDLDKVDKRRK